MTTRRRAASSSSSSSTASLSSSSSTPCPSCEASRRASAWASSSASTSSTASACALSACGRPRCPSRCRTLTTTTMTKMMQTRISSTDVARARACFGSSSCFARGVFRCVRDAVRCSGAAIAMSLAHDDAVSANASVRACGCVIHTSEELAYDAECVGMLHHVRRGSRWR